MNAEINSGSNPVSRIAAYFKARKIKTTFNDILLALKEYVIDQKNLYGLDIRKEKVQYNYLIFTNKTTTSYPTTQQVYNIVEELRAYAAKSGAGEIFYPMLNVKKIDNSTYEAQVGLPVDKKLPDTESISTKWMMKDGNILAAEVTGGQQQIEEAFKKFELYILENKRSIIAIPFQMLITDRVKEPDSSKWVTKLYYPVV
jgi:effector-binding domain-containing protein